MTNLCCGAQKINNHKIWSKCSYKLVENLNKRKHPFINNLNKDFGYRKEQKVVWLFWAIIEC